MTNIYFQTDPFLFFFIPVILLLLPLRWVWAAVLAALIHEIAHIIHIVIQGGTIQEIRIGSSGTVIRASINCFLSNCISILSGPVFSLSLLLFDDTYPELAYCGLIQGLYNLIPVLPLDGGRLLYLLLCRYLPQLADTVMDRLFYLCIFLILGSMIYTFLARNWHFAFAEGILLFSLIRKTPCKEMRIKVQ